MSVSQKPHDAPSLGGMLKHTLSVWYDYLQLVVGGTVLWCLVWLVPVGVASLLLDSALYLPVGVLAAALTVGPASLGLACMSLKMVRRDDPGIAHFFWGYTRFFWRGVWWALANALIAGGCVWNVVFYTSQFKDGRYWPIGVLWVYVLLYWLFMQLYAPQFIVRENSGVWNALRKSALLVAGNLGCTAVVAFEAGVVIGIVVLPLFVSSALLIGVSVLVAFFLCAGTVLLVGAGAVENLMRQYEQPAETAAGNSSSEEEAARA